MRRVISYGKRAALETNSRLVEAEAEGLEAGLARRCLALAQKEHENIPSERATPTGPPECKI